MDIYNHRLIVYVWWTIWDINFYNIVLLIDHNDKYRTYFSEMLVGFFVFDESTNNISSNINTLNITVIVIVL